MKTRKFALCLAAVFLVAIYINIQRSHTFTLSNDEGNIKTEQIQPLWGTVKVSGDCDTEVVFTRCRDWRKIQNRIYYTGRNGKNQTRKRQMV